MPFMNSDNSIEPTKKEGPMKLRSIAASDDMWEQCKRKAGIRPMAAIVRELLQAWLDGKIKIE